MTEPEAATREATATATAPDAPHEDITASQATRGRARARKAEATTDTVTDSDDTGEPQEPSRTSETRSWLARQPAHTRTPAGPRELWERGAAAAGRQEGWAPRFGLYGAAGLGSAVTAVLLGLAWLLHRPLSIPLGPLADLNARIGELAAGQPDRSAAQVGVRALGVAVWTVVAALYGLAYLVQYPALQALLGFCGGIAFLTSIF